MTSRAVPPAVLHPGGSYVLFLYQSVATAPWFPANGLHGIFDISDSHVTLRCPNYLDPASAQVVETDLTAAAFEQRVRKA